MNAILAIIANGMPRGWGVYIHQNHGDGGGNVSIMVGMFVYLCLASQKPSEQEFFVPVIGHGIGGKYIPIMARLAKARHWSKR